MQQSPIFVRAAAMPILGEEAEEVGQAASPLCRLRALRTLTPAQVHLVDAYKTRLCRGENKVESDQCRLNAQCVASDAGREADWPSREMVPDDEDKVFEIDHRTE